MIRFEAGGWWLPDGEQHLQQWMNQVRAREAGPILADGRGETRLTYQYHKYSACRPFTRAWRTAVDVGAHVGLWSWVMARDFGNVVGFEPMPEHAACWRENMDGVENASLLPFALGAEPGTVVLKTRTPGSSGDTGVDPAAERSSLRATVHVPGYDHDAAEGVSAELRRLDDFDLGQVDFIKIDCEGYELWVLQGAVETLKRCKPCLIVEQKPETGMEERYGVTAKQAIDFLEGLGARLRKVIQGDYIFSWDG